MAVGEEAEENPAPESASSAITIATPASNKRTMFRSFSAWWALSAVN